LPRQIGPDVVFFELGFFVLGGGEIGEEGDGNLSRGKHFVVMDKGAPGFCDLRKRSKTAFTRHEDIGLFCFVVISTRTDDGGMKKALRGDRVSEGVDVVRVVLLALARSDVDLVTGDPFHSIEPHWSAIAEAMPGRVSLRSFERWEEGGRDWDH